MILLIVGMIGYTLNAFGCRVIEDDGYLFMAYVCELFLETILIAIYLIIHELGEQR